MTVSERVAKGAAELDRAVPGWFNMIDTERLDVSSVHHCIMGQLEIVLNVTEWSKILPNSYRADYAVECGLLRDFRQPLRQEYADLTEEWRKVIAERKNS